MDTLYHYTKVSYIESILKEGLFPGRMPSLYGSPPDEESVWLDEELYPTSEQRGWTVVCVKIEKIDQSKLSRPRFGEGWWKYCGWIPPDAICPLIIT